MYVTYNMHKQGKVWELSLVKVFFIYICKTAFICKQTYLNHSEQTYRKITLGVSHEKSKVILS